MTCAFVRHTTIEFNCSLLPPFLISSLSLFHSYYLVSLFLFYNKIIFIMKINCNIFFFLLSIKIDTMKGKKKTLLKISLCSGHHGFSKCDTETK